jgi:hypothetical protein
VASLRTSREDKEVTIGRIEKDISLLMLKVLIVFRTALYLYYTFCDADWFRRIKSRAINTSHTIVRIRDSMDIHIPIVPAVGGITIIDAVIFPAIENYLRMARLHG